MAHTGNAADHCDGAINLALVVDKATELNVTLTRDDGNIEALDALVGQQSCLDLGRDQGVINLAANRRRGASKTHVILDALDPCHCASDSDGEIDLCLFVNKAAELDFALAG